MYSACRYSVAFVAAFFVGIAGPSSVQAQGLFDFLFRPPASSNARSYASPSMPGLGTSEAPAARAPRLSGTGRNASYCVRLCDGRYFPVQRTSTAQPGELCSSLCPASKTKVFSGSDINYATASDGTRYSSLENAFVYREKVVDGCTCNGTDAFGLAKIALTDDPTLRKGDMIATEQGLEAYNGPTRAAVARANNGTASDADPLMTSGIRGSVDSGERPRERRVKRPTFSIFGLRF